MGRPQKQLKNIRYIQSNQTYNALGLFEQRGKTLAVFIISMVAPPKAKLTVIQGEKKIHPRECEQCEMDMEWVGSLCGMLGIHSVAG